MLVFTSCSSTKQVPTPLSASGVRARSLDGFAREWVAKIQAARELYAARDVYAGLAVTAAREAARRLEARLDFVSAGMSVVQAASRIPGYDLTVSSPGPAPYPIASGHASPSAWWSALNKALGRHQPLANIVRKHDDLVLLALPGTYLQMVEPELLTLGPAQRRKLRLVVSRNTKVGIELQSQTIRYDLRLQALDEAPKGALTSFTQRALLHFSSLLQDNPRIRAVASQQRLVDAALSLGAPAQRHARKAVSDTAVAQWVTKVDPLGTKTRSALLNEFRAKGMACEYGRFFRIVDSVRN